MSYQIADGGAIRVSLTSWNQRVPLQRTFQGVRASKIKWLTYQTVSTGNRDLMLLCNELDGTGWYPLPDGSNVKHLISLPLDQSATVSCTYSNFTSEFDDVYQVPRNIVELNFQVFINGIPATEVSGSNPVDFVVALYE